MYKTSKLALVGSAVVAAALAFNVASSASSQARPVWFGPGSGPISPYASFKGFNQVLRRPLGMPHRYQQPGPSRYHCVPNVGLVGANGVCPD